MGKLHVELRVARIVQWEVCNWYSIGRETMLKSIWQEDKRIGRDQNNYIINNRHETIHDH